MALTVASPPPSPLPHNHPLLDYIQTRLVDGLPPTETKTHRLARQILKTAGGILAIVGKIPFIAINLKLAGDNMALGVLLAYGNCTSFSALIFWAMCEMIDGNMRPMEDIERRLLGTSKDRHSIKILITSIITGLIGFVA